MLMVPRGGTTEPRKINGIAVKWDSRPPTEFQGISGALSHRRSAFKQLHLDMTACFDREQRAGWQSHEVENYATRVRNYLWEIANNENPHHSAFKGLAEDTENLAKARAK